MNEAHPTPANILIVDDTPANLQVLAEMLDRRGFTTRPVTSGRLALRAIEAETPDLILMDVSMPEQDGYAVCRQIKADSRFARIPVIFISSLTETIDKVKAFTVGGVDYITKPIEIQEVYARVETHLKIHRLQQELEGTVQTLEQRVQEQVREISDSQNATIFALAKLAESRDDETGKHLERVRAYCRLLALGMQRQPETCELVTERFVEIIYQSSPLHDIGKVGIPDRILLKPGKLTPAEFEMMKHHTAIGADTLRAVSLQYPNNPILNMGIDIARHHHERWDGSGYPDGLRGKQIPLAARIMAVADVYDALRSRRVYKPALRHEQTSELIVQRSGAHFDPVVVKVYEQVEEEMREVYERMVDEGVKLDAEWWR